MPPVAAGFTTALAIVPSSSATRWTVPWMLLTKHTLPLVPTVAKATFGSTVPGPKLTFDVVGDGDRAVVGEQHTEPGTLRRHRA